MHSLRLGKHPVAVMRLDLARFKIVNDTLSHPAGDPLLRMAADRFTRRARKSDLVAHLGGDEFAIIQLDGDQPAAAEALAVRLQQAMAVPFEIAEQQVSVGACIGVALSDAEDGIDPTPLLKRADLALCDAKSMGRGTHRFFRPEIDRRAKGWRELETGLCRDIEQRAIESLGSAAALGA